MIAFATSTTVASVGMLVDKSMYGAGGDAMLLALAVLSLVSSLVVSSVSYGTRSKAMESNYKKIQQIALSAEDLKGYSGNDKLEMYKAIRRDYEAAVDSSENHTQSDYRAMQEGAGSPRTWARRRDELTRAAPYVTLAAPIALLIPFATWFIDGL